MNERFTTNKQVQKQVELTVMYSIKIPVATVVNQTTKLQYLM